jgi:hypothetical protein
MSSGNTLVFYHIFCNEKTLPVVQDQVTKLIFSGLYENVTSINCFVVGEETFAQPILSFLSSSGSKFNICEISHDDKTYERFTLTKINKYIQPEDKFLYMHTKGVSKDDSYHNNVYDWRTFMEYNLFHKYQECIALLDVYDVVGVNFQQIPSNHFSGNFWWCRGSYYMKLHPAFLYKNYWGSTYLAPEMYVCTANPNLKELTRSTIKDHYKEPYSYGRYV